MPDYATGIDDIATMNGAVSGWTIVSVGYGDLRSFEIAAEKILRAANLRSFHGKEFVRRKSDSYVEFMKLVRSTLESGPGYISCILLGQDWKSMFEAFCANVIGGSFSIVGIEAGPISEASKRIAAPLFTYQRLAAKQCQGGSTLIHIDRHALYDGLDATELEISGRQISGQLPIVAALRAYGRKTFPNAPEIERDSIFVCADECSFLVQAADVVGNFSTALAFRHLGRESKSNDLKCSVIEQAFGDILDFSSFPSELVRNGTELALPKGSASITFNICGAGT
jgi:hypothetical protein